MKTRIESNFEYKLAGFPVVIQDAPLVCTQEDEFPLIDYEKLERLILIQLARKETRLTGNQVRFIRHAFEMSLREFAKLFRFTAPSVHKWEKSGGSSTAMEWPAELLLRTEVLLRFATPKLATANWLSLRARDLPDAPPDECLRLSAEEIDANCTPPKKSSALAREGGGERSIDYRPDVERGKG